MIAVHNIPAEDGQLSNDLVLLPTHAKRSVQPVNFHKKAK